MVRDMTDTLFPLPESVAKSCETEAEARQARVLSPNRDQLELRPVDLESLLPPDHRARLVWEFVTCLDLTPLYAAIRSVEGGGGRPATDPRVMMALWLYATLEGVGSARALDRLCDEHDAYRWICGGVGVNYHTLAEFRVAHTEFLDHLLTTSIASLMASGAVTLERVAQDGVRVRASAGAASFHRRSTLERLLDEATTQVEALKQELHDDPAATSRRRQAARKRAAEERQRRVEEALAQLPDVEAKKKADEKDQARVSSTDPDARVMKMADGGFRPAFNGQFATDTATQLIVGLSVSNGGSDQGRLSPMVDQLRDRYGKSPKEVLADGGYNTLADIEKATEMGATVYAPVPKPKDASRDPHEPLPNDTEHVAAWRRRMGTDAAKLIYKQRAATAECVNALARNRGLRQFLVRGLVKAKAVLLWFALAHNVLRTTTLGAAAAAA